MSYTEHYYQSADGLNLYYRDYEGDDTRLPFICLSGLTRNSGDFHDFATRYSGTRRIFALDYRGRGKSQYDKVYQNYDPQTYLSDVFLFLKSRDIEEAVFIGTSLGGILTMAMAGFAPQYVAAVLLNDIGPDVDQSGSERIAEYVGNDIRYPTIEAVAKAQKEQFSNAYPDLDEAGWIKTSKISFILDQDNKNYRPNYDLAIGRALKEQLSKDQAIDLWPLFESLKNVPTLAIRGARSDVLCKEVFDKMQKRHPLMETLTLENRGHVPLLDESMALQKMDQYFDLL